MVAQDVPKTGAKTAFRVRWMSLHLSRPVHALFCGGT